MAISRLLLIVLVALPSKPLGLSPPLAVDRRDVLRSSIAVATSGGLLVPNFPAAAAAATVADLEPSVILPGGTSYPLASFGLQVYNDETAYKLTLVALEIGYRNFFASVLAGNQRGFAKAVRDSGVPRGDLFICGSVVSNRAKGFDEARVATTGGWKRNMAAFSAGNIDYLDQIMLDYPGPDCDSIRGQWRAFEDMHEAKLTKTLAVSNFSPQQLDCIVKDSGTEVRPVVNQLPLSVAYHPGGDVSNTVKANRDRGLLVQAWAPLGGSLGGRFDARIRAKCAEIGKRYGKSGAQVALRWIVQSGAAFTTQSKVKEHFAEDLNIFDFALSAEDMDTLGRLS